MSNSKRHHYVAKAILKNFCEGGESLFYVKKDSQPSVIERRNIKSIFCRRHINSFPTNDGMKDDTVERFFGEHLDNFIPHWQFVFEMAISQGNVVFDSLEDKQRFKAFFYFHVKRTPDFTDPIIEKVSFETFNEQTIQEFEDKHRKLTDDEISLFHNPEFRSLALGQTRVVNLSRQSEKILKVIEEMNVIVATPKRNAKNFIVGSNPVVRFCDYPSQPLGERGVELWTTFSPKIAVGLVARSASNNSVLLLEDEHVRKINHELTKKSRSIASASDKLLISLSKIAW